MIFLAKRFSLGELVLFTLNMYFLSTLIICEVCTQLKYFFVDRKIRVPLFPIDNQRADRSKPGIYSI